jgi:acyl carrier protein
MGNSKVPSCKSTYLPPSDLQIISEENSVDEGQVKECLAIASRIFEFEVKPEDAFYDIGGDSVHALELAMRVEKFTGVEVDAFEMVSATSLGPYFRSC